MVLLGGAVAQDREDFHDAVWSIAHGTVDVRPALSGTFPLEHLADAFAAAARADTYRVFVTPNGWAAARQTACGAWPGAASLGPRRACYPRRP